MNRKVNSVLAIAAIAVFGSIMVGSIYLLSSNLNRQTPQNRQENTPEASIKNNDIWKKYVSSGSLSFEYPAQDCDSVSGGECHDIFLSLVEGGFLIGTLKEENVNGNINEYIQPNTFLYYEQDLSAFQNEEGVEKYLKKTFNNECLIESWNPFKGTQIKEAVLSIGCRMWGASEAAVKFFERNPDAKVLSGMQVGAFYNKDTGEVLIYSFGDGAGCDFQECDASEKMKNNIKFGEVKLSPSLSEDIPGSVE